MGVEAQRWQQIEPGCNLQQEVKHRDGLLAKLLEVAVGADWKVKCASMFRLCLIGG